MFWFFKIHMQFEGVCTNLFKRRQLLELSKYIGYFFKHAVHFSRASRNRILTFLVWFVKMSRGNYSIRNATVWMNVTGVKKTMEFSFLWEWTPLLEGSCRLLHFPFTYILLIRNREGKHLLFDIVQLQQVVLSTHHKYTVY